jgi:hypothetical protein
VVAFVDAESQRASEGYEHLLRRLSPTPLFQLRVVVDRSAGHGRHLVTTQAGDASTAHSVEPQLSRLQTVSA